jgi:hypothetical protein
MEKKTLYKSWIYQKVLDLIQNKDVGFNENIFFTQIQSWTTCAVAETVRKQAYTRAAGRCANRPITAQGNLVVLGKP